MSLLDYVNNELLNHQPDVTVGVHDDLLTSGFIDSMGVMRLVMFIEETWSIRVPPIDVTIENFQCVDSINQYLRTRVGDSDSVDCTESEGQAGANQ